MKNIINYQKEVNANRDEVKEAIESLPVATKEILNKIDFEIVSVRERMVAGKNIDSMAIKMDNLRLLVDNYSKIADIYFQEIVRMNQESDRLRNGY